MKVPSVWLRSRICKLFINRSNTIITVISWINKKNKINTAHNLAQGNISVLFEVHWRHSFLCADDTAQMKRQKAKTKTIKAPLKPGTSEGTETYFILILIVCVKYSFLLYPFALWGSGMRHRRHKRGRNIIRQLIFYWVFSCKLPCPQ